MLSYQHSYHAGSLADVHKHSVLALVLAKLIEKDKPLTYFETHAGRGLYDLTCEAALKTQEAQHGIIALLNQNKSLLAAPYYRVISHIHQQYGKNFYPGSPLIAHHLLRNNDVMHLMELHPQEHLALVNTFKSAKNVHIHLRDGYEGVLALTPPPLRRGIVFLDPSYEIKTEYQHVAEFVLALHKKWPEAVILVWYPLLKEAYQERLVRRLQTSHLPKVWHQETVFSQTPTAMHGSGMIGVNMPYGVQISGFKWPKNV